MRLPKTNQVDEISKKVDVVRSEGFFDIMSQIDFVSRDICTSFASFVLPSPG